MTSENVAAALLRRWYVTLAGVSLMIGAIFALSTNPGVYSTQADVLFLAPKSAQFPNPIEATSESLIATAGLVAHMANGVKAESPTASSGVTLTGEGIRKGYSIRLPNSGGQWASNFDRPVLVVQVAGPTEAWVRSTLATQIDKINNSLYALQKADRIPTRNLITTSSTPRLAKVEYSKGDPKRAVAALILLGSALTALGALGFDGIAPGSARSRPTLRPRFFDRTESV